MTDTIEHVEPTALTPEQWQAIHPRTKRPGFAAFVDRLILAGWLDLDGDTALVKLRIQAGMIEHEGERAVLWTAERLECDSA